MSDLTADPGTSQVHLFFDVLRDASVQRLVSISLGVGLTVTLVASATALAVFVIAPLKQPSQPLAHHLIVRRDRTGRVTAVVGAPATVVFNPKTKRVVSIRARARSGGLSGR
jgi:hypothetical protein